MRISDLIGKLGLQVLTGPFDQEIEGGYASDLLSDVLANGSPGCIWVTIQVHRNIVAVASLKDFAGIIVAGGRQPEEASVTEAARENLNLLTTSMSSYEVIGKLYELGIRQARAG